MDERDLSQVVQRPTFLSLPFLDHGCYSPTGNLWMHAFAMQNLSCHPKCDQGLSTSTIQQHQCRVDLHASPLTSSTAVHYAKNQYSTVQYSTVHYAKNSTLETQEGNLQTVSANIFATLKKITKMFLNKLRAIQTSKRMTFSALSYTEETQKTNLEKVSLSNRTINSYGINERSSFN